MELIADFHIHSHYSRATSRDMNLEGLYRWGKIKGINLIGTGDFTHPEWLDELKEKLEPAEPGLYRLKDSLSSPIDQSLPEKIREQTLRFIPTAEISNIYSRADKVRKVHNLVIVPSLAVAAKINAELSKIGNLKADGRPILGLDSEKLLKIVLDADKDALLVPAHIWTPWFSMFGSKSGFDSIQEAFGEMSKHIRAVETGLSSDPFMNWRLDGLQELTIISNSDAHSPAKLGREATRLDCRMDYQEIINALRTNDQRLVGTIEFFPQEGKYHADGHRICQTRFSPEETRKRGGICPKCDKPLVLGVDYRVSELANHPENFVPKKHKSVEYIIPLVEILAQMHGTKSVTSKKIQTDYTKLYSLLGNEFNILRQVETAEIEAAGFPHLAKGIEKMRKKEILVEPGYDGVFGVIRVFEDPKAMEKEIGHDLAQNRSCVNNIV